MGQISVDQAWAQLTTKRGGGFVRVPIDEQTLTREDESHVIAIDQAIKKLEALDPIQALHPSD